MYDASVEYQLTNSDLGESDTVIAVSGGEQVLAETTEIRVVRKDHSFWRWPASAGSLMPHGVKSAPKVIDGMRLEPGNFDMISYDYRGMTKTAGEHHIKGRSLRSSPRVGKPSTWRRETVDTTSRQEVGTCSAW